MEGSGDQQLSRTDVLRLKLHQAVEMTQLNLPPKILEQVEFRVIGSRLTVRKIPSKR